MATMLDVDPVLRGEFVPTEETLVGYRRWIDTSDPEDYVDCGWDAYVFADGSAKVVWFGVSPETRVFAPGEWKYESMAGESFGSRGGVRIREV